MTENSNASRPSAALRSESLRIEEDCIHSSKSHFNAADTWRRRHYWLGIPATTFAALAGAAVVGEVGRQGLRLRL